MSEAPMAAVSPRHAPRFAQWRLATGATITTGVIAVALLSLVWMPQNPIRIRILQKLQPPLTDGLFGTDHLGRDVLSMVMAGSFNSLSISLLSVLLGMSVGTALGILCAARRGAIDTVIMRVCDAIFALPPLISAIMIAALLGGGVLTAVIAIATFMVPVFARIGRSTAQQIWARDYVLAARMAGRGRFAISFAHVLPNIASQIIVQAAIQLALAMLTEAGLSFLGLGVAPPNPSWGRMLADSQTYLGTAPYLALVPGLAIAITVLGLNLLGDGLRDYLDPRQRL